MADAPDSKFGRGNPVRVQVPPPAPLILLSRSRSTGNSFLAPFPSALQRGRSPFEDRKSHPLQAGEEGDRTKHKKWPHVTSASVGTRIEWKFISHLRPSGYRLIL